MDIFSALFKKPTDGSVTINGVKIQGRNVTINGDKIIVDGKVQQELTEKNITLNIQVSGNVQEISTTAGDVILNNSTVTDIKTVSDSIQCTEVQGNVTTISGKVTANTIKGSVSTISGKISTN